MVRTPMVKVQAMPAYDSRNIQGIGVTYMTSTMGADHGLVSWNISEEESNRFDLSHHEIEKKILGLRLIPKQYRHLYHM